MNDGSEFICKKCEGTGRGVKLSTHYGMRKGTYAICPDCYGKGKLDWIENILGKKTMFHHNPNVAGRYEAG